MNQKQNAENVVENYTRNTTELHVVENNDQKERIAVALQESKARPTSISFSRINVNAEEDVFVGPIDSEVDESLRNLPIVVQASYIIFPEDEAYTDMAAIEDEEYERLSIAREKLIADFVKQLEENHERIRMRRAEINAKKLNAKKRNKK